MLLIEMTVWPGAVLGILDAGDMDMHRHSDLRFVARRQLGPQLPELCIKHKEALGLEPSTPELGVQVLPRDYDTATVNPADLWIKVQFTEDCPDKLQRLQIREAFWNILAHWFPAHGYVAPDNLVLEVSWGPSHGCGKIENTCIEW